MINYSAKERYQLIALVASCLVLAMATGSEAGQGCPFNDDSCSEYCGQQGCDLGYCGHFAWIQCICRKCGDEWNSYDKIRFKPDEKVNQTELDSLKLNSSSPLILTSATSATNETAASTKNQTGELAEAGNKTESADVQAGQVQTVAPEVGAEQNQKKQQQTTVTTLVIPDLGETSKDLNDVPDENSDKFLDYLTNNHERLVQATRLAQKDLENESGETDSTSDDSSNDDSLNAEDTVEIQIKTENNQQSAQKPEESSARTESNVGPLMKLVKQAAEQQPQPQQQQPQTQQPTSN